MNAETAAVLLVICMAPAATLFPLIYGFTSPWWKSLVGRALLTKSVGFALLIDLALVDNFLWTIPVALKLVVYSLILAGVWLQLAALLVEKYRARQS